MRTLRSRLAAGRLRRVLAVLVATWLLVTVPAQAFATVPPPVADPRFDWEAANAQMRERQAASRLPGSALGGASRGQTVSGRIAGATRSVVNSASSGRVTLPTSTSGTVGKFGTVLRGAGSALTSLFVLDMTYTAFTGGYGSGFGFAGLTGYQSDGMWCDITNLAGGGTTCGVGPAPTYIPNTDFTWTPPGWGSGLNHYTLADPPGTSWTNITYFLDVQSAPAFQQVVTSGGVVRLGMVLEGTCDVNADSGSAPPVGMWSAWRKTDGTLAYGGGSYYPPNRLNCVSTFVWDIPNVNGGGSLRFDHLRFGPTTAEAAPVSWYPEGHANWTPGTEENPLRWFRTEWLCEGGSIQSAKSADFREADPEWPAPVDPVCDGSAVQSVSVWQEGAGVPSALLYEWTLPAEVSAFADAYPECVNGGCLLELHYLDAQTGTRLACFDNPELCLGWFTNPQKTTQFACTYGTHDVVLDECNMYAPTFDPNKWPATGTPPYADPETGEEGAGAPPASEPDGDGCPPPFSWSALWNNYWLFKAVQCGAEAAGRALFVPKNMDSTFAQTWALWQDTSAYKWGLALSTMLDDVDLAEGGCRGPGGNIFGAQLGGSGVEVYPFSACDPPMSDYAPFVKQIAGFLIGLGAFWSCANSLGRGFGYGLGPAPVGYVQGTLW